jgi:hypothetical protein
VNRWLLLPLALGLLALHVATPAAGILLETGNGNGSAPPDPPGDPGFEHVARLNGLNGVYAGHGWLLTAAHVGAPPGSTFWMNGTTYPVISQSRIVIQHAPGTPADLAALRIQPYPSHLEPLEIIGASPPIGAEVLLVGAGADRNAPVEWTWDGWQWGGANGYKRWGTNAVGAEITGLEPLGTIASWPFSGGGGITQSLLTQFDEGGSAHEGVATIGDSGGALFARAVATDPWQLAGIQWAITVHPGQPYHTSVYGNDTLSADLGFYRQKVLAVIRPCLDGVDNDGDTLADFGSDPDCLWEGDMSELGACSDGIDNDWDGSIDTADADCASAADLLEEPDPDADLVPDARDNCQAVANADQRDTNADGYGNTCDADVSNDGGVGVPDFAMLSAAMGSTEQQPGYDPDLDLSGDGGVGVPDFAAMLSSFGMLPGPSGLTCAGTPPCP